MEGTTTFFEAFSDPNRLRTLNILNNKTLCLCKINKMLYLVPSTVSQYFNLLKKVGFPAEKRDGEQANYFIAPPPSDQRIPTL